MLTLELSVWCEQVSVANANWSGPWVSEPFCFPTLQFTNAFWQSRNRGFWRRLMPPSEWQWRRKPGLYSEPEGNFWWGITFSFRQPMRRKRRMWRANIYQPEVFLIHHFILISQEAYCFIYEAQVKSKPWSGGRGGSLMYSTSKA